MGEVKTRSLALEYLDKCVETATAKKDIEWNYWADLLRAMIFESQMKTRKVIEAIEHAELIEKENSTFPRCSEESKRFAAILKAESYLQLDQPEVENRNVLADTQKAMEAIHPKAKAFLYPQSIRNAIQTRDWKAVEPFNPSDTSDTSDTSNNANRVEELLSLLITVRFIELHHN